MPVRFLSKLHIDSNPVKEYAREQQEQTHRRTSKNIMPPRPTGVEEYKMWEFAS